MNEEGYTAAQFDMPTRHERIMAQSAYDDEIDFIRTWIQDHKLVLPICVIAIGTTTFALW